MTRAEKVAEAQRLRGEGLTLDALADILTEANRALEGMRDGRIPKGTSALQSIAYTASDALHDAHENGRMEYEPVKVP